MSFDVWLKESKPVIPVIVINDLDHAVPLAQALVAGGVKLLEVTMRTPVALAAIEKNRQRRPRCHCGRGDGDSSTTYSTSLRRWCQVCAEPWGQ